MNNNRLWVGLFVGLWAGASWGWGQQPAELPAINFQREILPLLSDRCFLCHGPDAASNESGLRLDLREQAIEEAPSGEGAALVPGDPEASLVWQRIVTEDAALVMPPAEAHRQAFTPEELTRLKRWITEGAQYAPHWAWQMPAESWDLPRDPADSWSRVSWDRWVWAGLKRRQLAPTPEASRERWLRRVSFDLSGFPPTPEQIQTFVEDQSPEAYERVVDRLLAAPTFGEHWAVSWLDAARYGDSYGYQSDQLCTVWPYRDWVVQAFNDNLPYDQFLTWQLAGDLLPNATREQRVATAFNRLHRQTNEGGSIDLEWRTEYAADRVNTFGSAMLGLTLECCRCHDHKFDPIPQRDYYQLSSFFNNIDEYGLYNAASWVPTPSLLLPTPPQAAQAAEISTLISKLRNQSVQARESVAERYQTWSAAGGENLPLAPKIHLDFEYRTAEQKFTAGPEGAVVATTNAANSPADGYRGHGVAFSGDDPLTVSAWAWEVFRPMALSMWIKLPADLHDAILLHQQTGTDTGFSGPELSLRDGKLFFGFIRFWPGNALAVEYAGELPRDEWFHLTVSYDGSVRAEGMRLAVNGRVDTRAVRDRIYKNSFSSPSLQIGERFRSTGLKGAIIDELRLFDQALSSLEIRYWQGTEEWAAVWRQASEAERAAHFEARHDELQRSILDELRAAERNRIMHNDPMTELMVMEELPDERPTYVLARGEYDAPRTPDQLVQRDTLSHFFPFPADAPRNRLGLARWLVHPQHPLTSRVAVNRIWQNFFGVGLVPTADDFGLQGAVPEYPELLDNLARDFIRGGWNVKALCREIALSATYRQDSRVATERWQADPQNLWLSRGPAQRLTAEQVRDLALFASGLYQPRAGGPPVSPYQPDNLWQENNSMSPAYQQSSGPDLFRRSLYSVWKRTAPLPNMLVFDAAGREVCSMSRINTNTPLQAMVTLNDRQFVEAAVHLAYRVQQELPEGSWDERLSRAFLWGTSRWPDPHEQRILRLLWDEQLAAYRRRESATDLDQLLAIGEAPLRAEPFTDAEKIELAAWTAVAQAILNCDEALHKR